MNIQNALKETGKARKEDNEAKYATLIQDEDAGSRENLVWEGEKDELVHYTDIMEDNWQPYHEEKEIRPETSTELWRNKFNELAHTTYRGNELMFVCMNESIPVDDVLIEINGWTRLYSPGEEDKKICAFNHACLDREEDVERIVIEGIEWKREDGWLVPFGGGEFMCSQNLIDKPPMRMIFEIPKESE